MFGKLVDLREACSIVAGGGIVAYPTETFYAVGCNACCAEAVARIYAVKRRDADKPLPLLAASAAALASCCNLDAAAPLAAFWPGPLTLLLPAFSPPLAPSLVSVRGQCAVRVTPHPLAAALSSGSGAVLTASSANLQGGRPAAVPQELAPEIACSVDGILPPGDVRPGGRLPSTIAEPEPGMCLRILREGGVSSAMLAQAGFSVRLSC